MKYNAIIQARMGSSRLPGKVMKLLKGQPMIHYIVDRIRNFDSISNVIISTTELSEDDAIVDYARKNKILYYRGSEENVLERFYNTVLQYPSDAIIRATCDNPLVDNTIWRKLLQFFERNALGYAGCKKFPLGASVEVFQTNLLVEAHLCANQQYEFEHVTPYMYMVNKNFAYLESEIDYSDYRFTVDTPEDFLFMEKIYKTFEDKQSDYLGIIEYLNDNPQIREINSNIHQKRIGE